MNDVGELHARLLEMRRAFDASFAEPAAGAERLPLDFVALRIGDQPHVIRTTEIAGLYAGLAVTPVPTPVQSLMGIAGHAGEMLPVYDLGLLLGVPASDGSWAVIDAGNNVVLLFSVFEDHWRIEADALVPTGEGSRHKHVQQMARHGEELRPVIAIPSILQSIREHAAPSRHKE